MTPATIYTRMFCGYCTRALALLRDKPVELEIIEAGFDVALRAQMRERSGGRDTFPQIFIGDVHVGGYDDLAALDAGGGLDALIAEHAG